MLIADAWLFLFCWSAVSCNDFVVVIFDGCEGSLSLVRWSVSFEVILVECWLYHLVFVSRVFVG